MNKLNRMERKIAEIIILAVVVILIGVLLRSFIYAPNNEQIAKQEAEIESLAEKVEESQKAPALIVSYREKINALIGGSEENANLLNKTIDVPDILRLVETAGTRSGVVFNEISMNGNASFVKGGLLENEDGTQTEIVNAEQFYLLEMKLKISCDYGQLWNFLKECENSGFYVTTDHVTISSNKTESGKLEGELQLNYYSIISSEMAEAAAGK